jgi:hypothetical protein
MPGGEQLKKSSPGLELGVIMRKSGPVERPDVSLVEAG